jgi:hypothetical protein
MNSVTICHNMLFMVAIMLSASPAFARPLFLRSLTLKR